MTMRLRPRAATGAVALRALAVGAVPATAPAATKNGITPKRPKAGARGDLNDCKQEGPVVKFRVG